MKTLYCQFDQNIPFPRAVSAFKLLAAMLLFFAMIVAPIASWASDITPPDVLIKDLSEQVLAELKKPTTKEQLEKNPRYIYKIVDELLVPHADFREMSRRVLGITWRSATPTQREEFQKVFTRLVVRTYAAALKDYDQQTIYFPKNALRYNVKQNLAEVRSMVREPGKGDTPVNYRLVHRTQGWKVYDLVIEGVSLVNSYRSQFAEPISRDGLDKVIKDIAERNKKAPKL